MPNYCISFNFDYEEEEHDGKPAHNFIYHLLNKISNEEEISITNVNYNEVDYVVDEETPLSAMPLRQVDSLDPADLPEPYSPEPEGP